MAKNNFKKLLKDFLKDLEIKKGRGKSTVGNYEFYLLRFLKWSKITSPNQINKGLVNDFSSWLNRLAKKDRTLKKSTQNYHLIALRAFLKYLAERKIKTLAPEEIKLAKMSRREIEFLEGSDLEKFLAAPLETKDKRIIQYRDKAILEILFSTGLRVSELANLKRKQVNLKQGEFIVKGRGNRQRSVFLSNQAKYWLKQYVRLRKDSVPALFIRHDKARKRVAGKGKRLENLTPRSIQRLVQKYRKIAGLTKKVTPHVLRHSFAKDLLKRGVDIKDVQARLGHVSITTMQIYKK